MKGSKALIFAILFGLLAALAAYFYIAQYKKLLFGGFERQPVVAETTLSAANKAIRKRVTEFCMAYSPLVRTRTTMPIAVSRALCMRAAAAFIV